MPSEKTTKEKLQSYFFDGAWSLGLATLITGGIVSPLTLIISGGLFTMQAAGGFPVTRILSSVREAIEDFLDPDFKPDANDESTSDDEYDSDPELEDHNQPLLKQLYQQLYETSVDSFLPPTGIRKFPGMTWLLGEETGSRPIATMNQLEVATMPYGSTRSGSNFRTGKIAKPKAVELGFDQKYPFRNNLRNSR